MNLDEQVRESHRPDWVPVFLGVTCTFAIMGVLSMVGMSVGALNFGPHDSIASLVLKGLWLIFSITFSMYSGGFCAGIMLDRRGRVIAAMDGLLVWLTTVVLFAVVSWFGYSPLPGVVFRSAGHDAPQGLIWMVMMLGTPTFFATAFGAMYGNDHVRAPATAESETRETKVDYDRAA